MLVITNGKVLVDPAMNAENMAEFIENLEDNIENFFEEKLNFEKVEKPFLQYKIPEDLSWRNLKEAIPANIQLELMGIGKDDEVTIPYPTIKTVKHIYTVEELQKIADEMCVILEDMSKLEAEKKSIAKRLGEQINGLQISLNEHAKMHRQGFEDKDTKCYVIMNFKDRVKCYHDFSSGELVHTEDMTLDDQRTLFDIKGFDPEDAESLQGFDITEVDENGLTDEENKNLDEVLAASEASEQAESTEPVAATDMEEI